MRWSLCIVLATTSVAAGAGTLAFIQSGTSAGGQHWTQRAKAENGRIVVRTEMPARQMIGGATLSRRLAPSVPLAVHCGAGLGAREDEYELDGFVYRTVERLRVRTVRRTVTFRPRRAPAKARARWPQLGRARFFVRFFEAADQPRRIEALDAHGHPVARRRCG